MNKTVKIITVIVVLLILGFLAYGMFVPVAKDSMTKADCPDEKIINKMPGTSPQSSYYIKDGVRKEISDYDESWVLANCTVPEQEVF